jgi:CheY-like chemotaxis protein/HPt (histidine-containing phosphotransfer) domain-containing protein
MRPDQGERIEALLASLMQEFRDDTVDVLDGLAARLKSAGERGIDSGNPLFMEIHRHAHNLKGQGGSFNFPSVTVIAHRLEDYLIGLESLEPWHIEDVLKFIDAMAGILEAGSDPGTDACGPLLRGLPTKGSAEPDNRPAGDIEILLVATAPVLARVVEGKLHARGVRVVLLRKPLAALETVVRSRPDLVICSAIMNDLNGTDLVRAFGAMQATHDIPVALLTSFPRGHHELRDLPEGTVMIRHDHDLDGQIDALLGMLKAA